MNTTSTSTSLQILQLMKVKILEATIDLFIIVTINIEIHFFISIISISARIKVIFLNKRIKQTSNYIKNTFRKSHMHNYYLIILDHHEQQFHLHQKQTSYLQNPLRQTITTTNQNNSFSIGLQNMRNTSQKQKK
jgi:hypothetical protein